VATKAPEQANAGFEWNGPGQRKGGSPLPSPVDYGF